MATAYALAGKDGSVSGVGSATKVRRWEATIEMDVHDVTNFDSSGWREFVSGLKGCTGSISCVGDPPTIDEAANSVVLSEGTGGMQISGSAKLHNIRYNVDIEGEIGHEFDFTMNGEATVGEVT